MIIIISHRYDVSDRCAASLASCLLLDLGLISEQNLTNVIDKGKVRREREKFRENMRREETPTGPVLCFDGRKDLTWTYEKTPDGRWRRRQKREEHYVLLSEPDSIYLGHVSPESGKAEDVTGAIMAEIGEKGHTNEISGVQCDGTNVNTGTDGGVITLIEKKLERPVQRLICLLHMVELPLRHVLTKLDGETTGPNAFSGPIGKQLKACEKLPTVKFRPIPVNVPEMDPAILSTDQQYLLRIMRAVSDGECPPPLANQMPGPINHARWLTLACRILRLYVSTARPTTNLKTITTFVMKVYALSWFEIRREPSCTHGARHLFAIIQRIKSMPQSVQKIALPVVQNNSFFAHSENILLSMLSDEREEVRQRALARISEIRDGRSGAVVPVRKFIVPRLNFKARDYISMSGNLNHDPPLAHKISLDHLTEMVKAPGTKLPWEGVPCHSQAVERHIRLVSDASKAVCGKKAREGLVRSKIFSRKLVQTFETKSDFQTVFRQDS